MSEDIKDLDLDRKMYEAKMQELDEKFKKFCEENKVMFSAVLYCDPVTGVVEPRILKQPLEDAEA